MTEGYQIWHSAPAVSEETVHAIELRVEAIEQLLVALHASFERIEAGMAVLLSEVRDLG